MLEGRLTLVIESEPTELGEGELIRVAPQVRRQLVNYGPDRVVVLALGGAAEHQGRDGEAFASWDDGSPTSPQEMQMPPDLDPGELRLVTESTMHPTAARVQQRLHERGLDVTVQVLPDSARTAAEAAVAVGCDVGQIVKSLVFMRDAEPVIVLCAGDRRVAAKRLGLRAASADEARAATGFSIGGIPPLAHDRPLETLIDESLRRFATVWSAAGTPTPCSRRAPTR